MNMVDGYGKERLTTVTEEASIGVASIFVNISGKENLIRTDPGLEKTGGGALYFCNANFYGLIWAERCLCVRLR